MTKGWPSRFALPHRTLGKAGCCARREHAQEVVGSGGSAKEQQKPRGLQVRQGREAAEYLVLHVALVAKFLLHRRLAPDWGAENEDALLGRGQGPSASPDWASAGCLEVVDARRFLACHIPDACLPSI